MTFTKLIKEISDKKEREIAELENKILMSDDDYEKMRLQAKIDKFRKVNGNTSY